MSAFSPAFQNLSICIRCQYRLATKHQRLPNSKSFRALAHLRIISHTRRLTQERAHEDGQTHRDPYFKPYDSRENSEYSYKPRIGSSLRKLNIYRKDAIGVESLGQPAEALILRPEPEHSFSFWARTPEKEDEEEKPSSADEMLEKVKAEQGIPGQH